MQVGFGLSRDLLKVGYRLTRLGVPAKALAFNPPPVAIRCPELAFVGLPVRCGCSICLKTDRVFCDA